MENMNWSSNLRNSSFTGNHSLLPPKMPFPTISPSYVGHSNGFGNPKEVVNSRHQRASSESCVFLDEQQPSWLDDLLNEPDTPVRKGGHRRSSSDSIAYIDHVSGAPTIWGSYDFERYLNINRSLASPGSSSVSQEADGTESGLSDTKSSSKMKDPSNTKVSQLDSDAKRAKQQFAQRSRVRKLQYIAELERSVQTLQGEGSEISGELEFINQQNLILNMENKTLKQRLDSLAQEQLIKYLEHEMLEREVGRLRMMCQQLQQQEVVESCGHGRTSSQGLDSKHRRSHSMDLNSQFSNLSMKLHNDVAPT